MLKDKNRGPRADLTTSEQQLNLARYGKALGRRGFMASVGLAGVSVAAGSILPSRCIEPTPGVRFDQPNFSAPSS